jgi:hypothetical protein
LKIARNPKLRQWHHYFPGNIMKKLIIAGTTLVGGLVLRKLLQEVREQVQDEPVPNNPDSRQTSWTKAVVWTISTASLAGLARLAIRKGLTHKLGENPS